MAKRDFPAMSWKISRWKFPHLKLKLSKMKRIELDLFTFQKLTIKYTPCMNFIQFEYPLTCLFGVSLSPKPWRDWRSIATVWGNVTHRNDTSPGTSACHWEIFHDTTGKSRLRRVFFCVMANDIFLRLLKYRYLACCIVCQSLCKSERFYRLQICGCFVSDL